MATDPYLAADERAREARRAGLQAKKDEQPANTARSYASKQREWKVRALPGRFYMFLYVPYRGPAGLSPRPPSSPYLLGQLADPVLEVVPHAAYGRRRLVV